MAMIMKVWSAGTSLDGDIRLVPIADMRTAVQLRAYCDKPVISGL